MTKCWSYFRSRRLQTFTDEGRIDSPEALVAPRWRTITPGGARRQEVWFVRLRTGELTEHARFPRRTGVYGNMDCRWCCPDTSELRLLPHDHDVDLVHDTSDPPLSLGAFKQYFQDYLRLYGPSDNLRDEAKRQILLVPPHERITYRICPYCVENRRPMFSFNGGIMGLRRHVTTCTRRPPDAPLPASLGPQRTRPPPRSPSPHSDRENTPLEDQHDHTLGRQRPPKWSVYTFLPASPPCLRSMLGESYKVPTAAHDPSRVATNGAYVETPWHLLMECGCEELQRLKQRCLNHLLIPGSDPPQVDRDLLQKAAWSNDRQLYLFFENSLSILPRRLLA